MKHLADLTAFAFLLILFLGFAQLSVSAIETDEDAKVQIAHIHQTELHASQHKEQSW